MWSDALHRSTSDTAHARVACDISLKSVGTRTRRANAAIRHSSPVELAASGTCHLVRQLAQTKREDHLNDACQHRIQRDHPGECDGSLAWAQYEQEPEDKR